MNEIRPTVQTLMIIIIVFSVVLDIAALKFRDLAHIILYLELIVIFLLGLIP